MFSWSALFFILTCLFGAVICIDPAPASGPMWAVFFCCVVAMAFTFVVGCLQRAPGTEREA